MTREHSRRTFLTSLGSYSALLGADVVFGQFLPRGLIPVALADQGFSIAGKDPGLMILNDRPVNAECPPHLLDDPVTPAERLFVRNNGIPPVDVKAAEWILKIDGEAVDNPRTFSLAELKREFEVVSYQLTIECGGNGRA